jgi:hypothetical protein
LLLSLPFPHFFYTPTRRDAETPTRSQILQDLFKDSFQIWQSENNKIYEIALHGYDCFVFPTRSLEGFYKAPVPKSVLAMSNLNFRDVFRAATGFPEPYAYQCRLACGPEASPENIDSLCHGTPCRSQLINIPTGLGKTAAAVIAWLCNRVLHRSNSHRNPWPRWPVYCLPMRTMRLLFEPSAYS